MKLIQPVQTVIYMYTLHSNQVKDQNHSFGYIQRPHAKRRDETLLTASRFIKLNQGNHEGYKPQSQAITALRTNKEGTPWIKPGLPGKANC